MRPCNGCEDGDEMSGANLPLLGNKAVREQKLSQQPALQLGWVRRPRSGLQLSSLLGRLNITHRERALPCSLHLQSRLEVKFLQDLNFQGIHGNGAPLLGST